VIDRREAALMQPMPVHSPDKMQMGARLPDLNTVQQALLVSSVEIFKIEGFAVYCYRLQL
jgi:hypothetical protein